MSVSPKELVLGLEDPGVVVVETDDHAAPNIEAGVLHFADAIDDRAALVDVLILLRLTQRFFVRAFDADEDGRDVGGDHQLHQLVVFGEVRATPR